MTGQIYVERLVPHVVKKKHPLVFMHGAAQSGSVCSDPIIHHLLIQRKLTPPELAQHPRQPRRLGLLLPPPRLHRLPHRPNATRPLSLAPRLRRTHHLLLPERLKLLHRPRKSLPPPLPPSKKAHPMARHRPRRRPHLRRLLRQPTPIPKQRNLHGPPQQRRLHRSAAANQRPSNPNHALPIRPIRLATRRHHPAPHQRPGANRAGLHPLRDVDRSPLRCGLPPRLPADTLRAVNAPAALRPSHRERSQPAKAEDRAS